MTEEETRQVAQHLQSCLKLCEALMDDVAAAYKDLGIVGSDVDTQPRRRALLRAIIAAVDGETFERKQLALVLHRLRLEIDSLHPLFSPGELEFLQERQYRLSENGIVKEQDRLLPFKDNLRLSFRALSRATGSDYELDTDTEGWQSLCALVDMRNRVTHPRILDDLEISHEDMRTIRMACEWYRQVSSDLRASVGQEHHTVP